MTTLTSAKALKLAIKEANTTLKACTETPLVGKRTLRVWGFEYVRSLLSLRIDDLIPAFTRCGITDKAGRPFINALTANDRFSFIESSDNLRFWSRMCSKVYFPNCEGAEEDKAKIKDLDTLIRSVDARGWTPYTMSLVIIRVLGLSAENAQKLLAIKASAEREAHEATHLAQCQEEETLTCYNSLERYEKWLANPSRTPLGQTKPRFVPRSGYQPQDHEAPVGRVYA